MANTEYWGCDRCGQLFTPQMRCDITIRLNSTGDEFKYQVCSNCLKLLTMTFRFTESRKVMEQQILQSGRN
jgi:hypothetical protein